MGSQKTDLEALRQGHDRRFPKSGMLRRPRKKMSLQLRSSTFATGVRASTNQRQTRSHPCTPLLPGATGLVETALQDDRPAACVEGRRRHLDVVGQRRAQVEEVELAPDRAALRLGSRAVRANAREVRVGARPRCGEREGAAVQPPAAGHRADEPLGVCNCLCKYAAIVVGVQWDIW